MSKNIKLFSILLFLIGYKNINANVDQVANALDLAKAIFQHEKNNPVPHKVPVPPTPPAPSNKTVTVPSQSVINSITSKVGNNLASLKKLISGTTNVEKINMLTSSGSFEFSIKITDTGNNATYTYDFGPNSKISNTQTSQANYWGFRANTFNQNGMLALLAFDENQNAVASIDASITYMALVMYDNSGNLITGMPLVFFASDYNENTNSQSAPITISKASISFIFNGSEYPIYSYPFLIQSYLIKSYNSLKSLNVFELRDQIAFSFNGALPANAAEGYDDDTKTQNVPSGYFSLSLDQMNGGKGYAFIQDPWNKITTAFANSKGVAASINTNSITNTIKYSYNENEYSGQCSLALLAFDKNNNYIPDITVVSPTQFGLFMYGANSKPLSGFPVQFNANNYVGLTEYQLKPNSKGPATFVLNGLGLSTTSLTYPFLLNLYWGSGQSSEY